MPQRSTALPFRTLQVRPHTLSNSACLPAHSLLPASRAQIQHGTAGMAERSAIRSGTSIFSVSNDSTPLTHSYTRMVNVVVVDRQNLPFSEQANQGAEDERHFMIKEATVMPQRTGMSLLMFDLCCSSPRVHQQRRGGAMEHKIQEREARAASYPR